MGWVEITALAVLALWWAVGITLFGLMIWRQGLPDYETYDGPAINWTETLNAFVLMVIGAPFWCWLIWTERPSPAPTPPGERHE